MNHPFPWNLPLESKFPFMNIFNIIKRHNHVLAREVRKNLMRHMNKFSFFQVYHSTDIYQFERSHFILSELIRKKEQKLKLALRTITYVKDLVANDYKVTVYNLLKTFYMFDTQLSKGVLKKSHLKHLDPLFLNIKNFPEIFFSFFDFLFYSGSNHIYQNFTFKKRNFMKQLDIFSFHSHAYVFSKKNLLQIFLQSKISFQQPFFIATPKIPTAMNNMTLIYLGFHFLISNLKAHVKGSMVLLKKFSSSAHLSKQLVLKDKKFVYELNYKRILKKFDNQILKKKTHLFWLKSNHVTF